MFGVEERVAVVNVGNVVPVPVRSAVPASHAWAFDTVHSSIQFSVRRLLLARVRGQFTKWRGSMTYDPARPEAAKVSVRIDAASIETGDADRDERLRSSDFLDVARAPAMTFESVKVAVVDERHLELVGVLTIRGVTQAVVLSAELQDSVRDHWGNEHLRVAAKTILRRSDFGLTWEDSMPAGEWFLGEDVEISIAIEATRLPAPRG
ncbi:MAG TPA: YceI family protein [Polyangiaceae bacterium]|jgi:polyisoprenoid-binding protein YceI